MNIIADGKTKTIFKTELINKNKVPLVEFVQKGVSVGAGGTTVIAADKNAWLLNEALRTQNDNIFTFLAALGFPTTYFGKSDSGLLHELCIPYPLEFVASLTVCDKMSMVYRQPEKYGVKDTPGKANPELFAPDGTVMPFKKPVLNTFHKYFAVEKEDGTVNLLPANEAKKNPRYFDGKDFTEYAHDDPLLVNQSCEWYPQDKEFHIYNQKKPLSEQTPLARLNESGVLRAPGKNGAMFQKMKVHEYIDSETNYGLQNLAGEIIRAICVAATLTKFQQASHVGNAGIVWKNHYFDGAFVMDGKCEFGLVQEGGRLVWKLTDDMVSGNMRWAMDWKPGLSLKSLLQNYDSKDGELLNAVMIAKGTEQWQDPKFIRTIRFILGR